MKKTITVTDNDNMTKHFCKNKKLKPNEGERQNGQTLMPRKFNHCHRHWKYDKVYFCENKLKPNEVDRIKMGKRVFPISWCQEFSWSDYLCHRHWKYDKISAKKSWSQMKEIDKMGKRTFLIRWCQENFNRCHRHWKYGKVFLRI